MDRPGSASTSFNTMYATTYGHHEHQKYHPEPRIHYHHPSLPQSRGGDHYEPSRNDDYGGGGEIEDGEEDYYQYYRRVLHRRRVARPPRSITTSSSSSVTYVPFDKACRALIISHLPTTFTDTQLSRLAKRFGDCVEIESTHVASRGAAYISFVPI